MKTHSLQCRHIVFFVVAAAAPLTGMLGAVPPAISLGNGAGIPGAYLLAGAILLLFSVGFASMSRHVVNAGAFYAYVAQGLGRPLGMGAAFVAVAAYTALQVALYGLFGFFGTVILEPALPWHVPWFVYSGLALILVQVLGVRQIEGNGALVGIFMILEMGILAALGIAIVVKGGGPQGLTLEPFAPSSVFGGHIGIAMMFALASFVGFEATAIYGEESVDPKRTVPLATYIAVVLIMLFFAFITWTIVCAYGPDKVAAAAASDPGAFWFNQSAVYLGSTATTAMSTLLLTSIFASILAFHTAIARYLYALSGDGLLPAGLATLHVRFGSPHKAGTVQTATAAVSIVIFAVVGADPFGVVFAWASAFATIGILGLQMLVCAAIIVYFRRTKSDSRLWHTLAAPALGGLGLFYVLVVLVGNLPALSGSESPVLTALPWAMLGIFGAGLLTGLAMRRRRPDLYRRFAGTADAPDLASLPILGLGD